MGLSMRDITRIESADSAQIAGWLAERLCAAGSGAITIPGGSTPFPILAELVASGGIDWSGWQVWPNDDRIVPEDHEASNTGKMRALLSDYGVSGPIRLEQNYRSAGTILDAANALIERNDGRLGKSLWTDAGPGDKIRLYEAYSDGEEAQFIVDEVKALEAPYQPIAVTGF